MFLFSEKSPYLFAPDSIECRIQNPLFNTLKIRL